MKRVYKLQNLVNEIRTLSTSLSCTLREAARYVLCILSVQLHINTVIHFVYYVYSFDETGRECANIPAVGGVVVVLFIYEVFCIQEISMMYSTVVRLI